MRWSRRLGTALLLVVGVCTRPALAHRIGGTRFDAPVPLELLLAGAGATVAVTAAWLALPTRDVPAASQRDLFGMQPTTARRLEAVLRAGFFALFVAAIVRGVVGRQVPTENLAVVFVWPVWLKGVALLSAAFGSPWRILSPWRALYDGLVRLEGQDIAVLGGYPERLGEWPALVGFLLWVGVLENLTVVPRSPVATAGFVSGYAAAMVLGGVAFGPEWFRRADALSVLYRLFGRVAPLRFFERDGRVVLRLRTPWQGCTDPVEGYALVGFVVATVYTVTFDGFASTLAYQDVLSVARASLDVGAVASVPLYLAGFGVFCSAFAGIVALSEAAGRAPDVRSGLVAFAPSLLPIAVAYEIAHNYPYVVGNAGQLVTDLGRQLTAAAPAVSPLASLSVSTFWLSQVALIVFGHVVAVVASHQTALSRYDSRRRATLAHVPLTTLMIGYTLLSLWIVSMPVVT